MISISAAVENSHDSHDVKLTTNGNTHAISVPPKASGYGSSANGGEMLFAALASCYCNDIYREAAKRGITVRRVQVEVSGKFDDAPGSVAENVSYRATVEAEAPRSRHRGTDAPYRHGRRNSEYAPAGSAGDAGGNPRRFGVSRRRQCLISPKG